MNKRMYDPILFPPLPRHYMLWLQGRTGSGYSGDFLFSIFPSFLHFQSFWISMFAILNDTLIVRKTTLWFNPHPPKQTKTPLHGADPFERPASRRGFCVQRRRSPAHHHGTLLRLQMESNGTYPGDSLPEIEPFDKKPLINNDFLPQVL